MRNLTKTICLFVILLSFSIPIKAQNIGIPPNAKPGVCYKLCFYGDKPFQWEETNCNKSNSRNKEKSEEDILCQEKIQEIREHQKKLKKLGFNVDVNGMIDDKTIFAHNKYLKQIKKAEKKANKVANNK